MSMHYGYKYARIREDGLCVEVQDTTNYILDRLYVPVETDDFAYLMKYYHPIPDKVTSFDDFHGLWYSDSAFTILVPELNT